MAPHKFYYLVQLLVPSTPWDDAFLLSQERTKNLPSFFNASLSPFNVSTVFCCSSLFPMTSAIISHSMLFFLTFVFSPWDFFWLMRHCSGCFGVDIGNFHLTDNNYADDAVLFTDDPTKWDYVFRNFEASADVILNNSVWSRAVCVKILEINIKGFRSDSANERRVWKLAFFVQCLDLFRKHYKIRPWLH